MSFARKPRTATARSKVIFNTAPVGAHLAELKSAALAEGKEDSHWWTGTLDFDWASTRKGNNGTQWLNVSYTDENGLKGRIIARINGERHTGQIMPGTEQGVADLAARSKNPNAKIEKRTRKPAIQIQKWKSHVKTEEDGVTIVCDADGQPILPGDEMLSDYFRMAYHIGEAFYTEAKERVDRGLELVSSVAAAKKANRDATAADVLTAFNTEQGVRRPGDMILSSESVGAIRRLFPGGRDSDVLSKGAIITSNVKIAQLVQEFISDQNKKNPGLPLPNPMTRMGMNFDNVTGVAQMAFFDKSAPYIADGKQKYDIGKVDGDPINGDNVHLFVLPRSGLDGIINMDSVCFSNMGISMPVKAEVLVVDKPAARGIDLDDVYDFDDMEVELVGVELAAGVTPAAAAAAPAAAAPVDDNYDDLLGELGADGVAPAK